LGCRKLTLAEEETVTVKKWYKLNEDAQAGRWGAEFVAGRSVLIWLETEVYEEQVAVWITRLQFEALFVENEMDIEMSAEELEGEREAMRDGN
jgi:hypothetical protein